MGSLLEINGLIINWELVARFVEALSWPVVALFGVAALNPLVRGFAQQGGHVSGFGVTIGIKPSVEIDNAAQIVESAVADRPTLERRTPPIPSDFNERPAYDLIRDGWTRLYDAIARAARKNGKRKVDGRTPLESVAFLRRRDVITKEIADAIEGLLRVRNVVRARGAGRFGSTNISDGEAREFFETSVRVASIIDDTPPRARGSTVNVTPGPEVENPRPN